MQVNLAGYNVDTDVLKELGEGSPLENVMTPEILSAAYARISRDPRSISEIRKDARFEVERTRKSNETIIFKMGHHSVAEHAVFNIDIIGASRLVMEAIERHRLCSYTEKSQRYITLEDDYVLPEEIKGTRFEAPFVAMIKEQNACYHRLFAKLKGYVFELNPELAANTKKHGLLEGWAKEDARYITALATEAQLGLTINARNLELMLRRFASSPLAEVRSLGRMIYEKVEKVAPSIIIFHEANDLDEKTYPDLKKYCEENIFSKAGSAGNTAGELVKLVAHDRGGDDKIAASLLHSVSSMCYADCMGLVHTLSPDDKKEIFKQACNHMQFYNSTPREFEYATLTFELVVSSACFGQLKRHRMSTQVTQEYNPELGITVPDSIKEIGMEKEFAEIADKSAKLYAEIREEISESASYILTNAHRKRVLMQLNARELYHMSRLREDAHAQWDINRTTAEMTRQAKEAMPLAFLLIGGKDRYNEIYEDVYGVPPKVREAVLPGTRKIK